MILGQEEHEKYFEHYGIIRKSGRYPWGSGGSVPERSRSFFDHIRALLHLGMTESEVAKSFDMTTTELRATKSIAKNQLKQADINMAQRLKEKGLSNGAIGERMAVNGKALNESSVRSLLAPGQKDKADVLQATASMLKFEVDSKGYIDVGSGIENHIAGVSRTKLDTAIAMLKSEGYELHNVQTPQLGTGPGNKTLIKVLAPHGTTYTDIVTNMDKIHLPAQASNDGGRTFEGVHPPVNVSAKRVGIRYAEDGGRDADGVIYLRPGAKDLSLGASNYAQVRIAVDGTHYIKGMAMYKEGLPEGVDLQFNTNKSATGNKLDALKLMNTKDPSNPFGATIQPGGQRGALNILNEEGAWDGWSRNLSSQTLSKQSPTLAKAQLNVTYERKKNELDSITSLTNPAVRKKLLDTYANSADSSAVHLKAAALPKSSWHVILPVNSLKETEIYAPNFNNGDRVALVRYPHGGTFEIPELTVNNHHRPAKAIIGKQAKDAVGINAKVAERLSGADFDGDAVLVIPNGNGKIKTSPALVQLKGFDPQSAYPAYDGMKTIDGGSYNAKTKSVDYGGKNPSPRGKGHQMGDVSNLITDMTIQRASTADIARAIKHSMVVIDAEKHSLDYKQSAIDNGIKQLKVKYQGKANAGASTLISKSGTSTKIRVPERKPRSAANGGPIDKATGKKVYEPTNNAYVDKKTGKTVVKTSRVSRLEVEDDAHRLSSGTLIEQVYADHSNRMKALGNAARKESVNTKTIPYSSSAKVAYKNEVASLNAKLNVALKNRPLERQAQLVANTILRAKTDANPNMDESDKKKVQYQALETARIRTGAKKNQIHLSDTEWSAIQAGAISNHKLTDILNNADLERVKQLATPKPKLLMSSAKKSRATSMAASGYTQAEIANALGVSLTTLKTSINE